MIIMSWRLVPYTIQRQVCLLYHFPLFIQLIYDRTALLTISPSQYGALKNLDFNIGSHTYSLTPNGQIWPRSLNQAIGGNSDSIYLIIASVSLLSGFFFGMEPAIDSYYINRLVQTLAKVSTSSSGIPFSSVSTASLMSRMAE